MNLKGILPFWEIKDDLKELKRENRTADDEAPNPDKTGRLCLFTTAISLPAGILSLIDKNVFMSVLFFTFGFISIGFAVYFFMKAKSESGKQNTNARDVEKDK